jgi:hypothetical protein
MIRGVVIEGLSTAGKTSVFSAIKQLHSRTPDAERTMVAISEHYSQVLHSYRGELRSMSKAEHIHLLNGHVHYLEHQYGWIDSLGHSKRTNGLFFMLERFHLNHRAAFENDSEMERMEERLLRLNAKCVLVTLSPNAVESRYIESRGEEWRTYVMNGHASKSEACAKFLANQEKLRACAAQSRIPTLEINTDEADWDAYARRIMSAISFQGEGGF